MGSQTGTVYSGLNAKVEFKLHASFSLVANLSERLLGLLPAKSHPGGTVPPRDIGTDQPRSVEAMGAKVIKGMAE